MSVKDYYTDKLDSKDLYYNWSRREVIGFIKDHLEDTDQADRQFEHVLDIGCANGKTGELFKKTFRTDSYVGLELIEEAAQEAEAHLDKVICGDIESMIRENELQGLDQVKYDVILCLDVLEHLVDPWETLIELRKWLKDDGLLVTSLPNFGNKQVVDKLLNDSLEYEDQGILDVTHLRFFTKHTIERMLRSTGFHIERSLATREYLPLRSKLFNAITFGRYKTLYIKQYFHISSTGDVTATRYNVASNDTLLKCFFGHHKCASTWATLVIERVCIEMGIKYGILYQKTLDKYDSVQDYLDKTGVRFLIIPEAGYEKVRQIKEPFRGFNLIRDPRDIIVSAYFSHMHSHPTKYFEELAEHRKHLQKLPETEGLMEEITFCKPYMDNMSGWDYDDPRITEWKYEDMIKDPNKMFHEVFAFLRMLNAESEYQTNGMRRTVNRVGNRLNTIYFNYKSPTITPERLDEILEDVAFKKLTKGRQRGQEDVKSHYRKGVANDWVNYFQDEHVEHFHKSYPDIMKTLGYEDE